MAQRQTPKAVIANLDGEGMMKQFPIFCFKCREKAGMSATRFRSGHIPWPAFQRHFVHLGWELGRDEKSDICPHCIAGRRLDKRIKRAQDKTAAVVPLHAPQPDVVVPFVPPDVLVVSSVRIKKLQAKFNARMHGRISEVDLLRNEIKALQKENRRLAASLAAYQRAQRVRLAA